MRIVRYRFQGRSEYGLVVGPDIYRLRDRLFGQATPGARVAALADVRLLAPLAPGKIIGIGLNYTAHAREMNKPLPASPLVFLKPPSAIIGPDQSLVCPPPSKEVHDDLVFSAPQLQLDQDALTPRPRSSRFSATFPRSTCPRYACHRLRSSAAPERAPATSPAR